MTGRRRGYLPASVAVIAAAAVRDMHVAGWNGCIDKLDVLLAA